jgi:hypothetical protein
MIGLLELNRSYKNTICCICGISPSADVKPMPNDLAHVMHAVHVCPLFVYTTFSMAGPCRAAPWAVGLWLGGPVGL